MNGPTSLFWQGSLASLLAGLGTVAGALAIVLLPRPEPRTQNAMLAAAAGVMLAASVVSLLLPAIEYSRDLLPGPAVLQVLIVLSGLFAGAVALVLAHRYAPHEHFVLGREGPDRQTLKRVWLFVIAITLHNFPEGMAVGVGFAGTTTANATSLAIGIGLQNAPEGLAVAGSMLAVGYARRQALAVASLTGLVEPIGGAIGSAAAWLTAPLMPFVLAFAAGAMLFIISGEIIPETHRSGYKQLATFSLLGGFALMVFLDSALE